MVYQCNMFLYLYTQRKYYFHLITKAQMAFFPFNSNQVNYRSCPNKHRSALSFLPFRKTRYGMFFFFFFVLFKIDTNSGQQKEHDKI